MERREERGVEVLVVASGTGDRLVVYLVHAKVAEGVQLHLAVVLVEEEV